MKESPFLTWAETDLKALRFNIRAIKRRAGKGKKILPVIKADAYGHGMLMTARVLQQEGISMFGVSDAAEGIFLRAGGARKKILLIESTLPESAKDVVDYNLTPTICTLELAQAIERYAKSKKKKISVHVKIDTGMGRLGVWHTQAVDFINELRKFKHIKIEGLFTHLSSADKHKKHTLKQLNALKSVVRKVNDAGMTIPLIHCANSIGLLNYKSDFCNVVRPGLILYGLYPCQSVKRKIQLKPVLSVKSKILFLKTVDKGRSISYERSFIAKKKMRVATLPIGYKDGYPRILSKRSVVVVKGKRCPILGNVTMDQIMIDVSKVKNIKLGDTVTILGREKKTEVTAEELAKLTHSINYEIVCLLGNQLPHIYKK